MQLERKSTKKAQIVSLWLSFIRFKRETVDCVIIQQTFR